MKLLQIKWKKGQHLCKRRTLWLKTELLLLLVWEISVPVKESSDRGWKGQRRLDVEEQTHVITMNSSLRPVHFLLGENWKSVCVCGIWFCFLNFTNSFEDLRINRCIFERVVITTMSIYTETCLLGTLLTFESHQSYISIKYFTFKICVHGSSLVGLLCLILAHVNNILIVPFLSLGCCVCVVSSVWA